MINLETQVTHQLQPANAGLGKVPGTVIPTTCSVGQVFVKTNSAEIYICTATDVMTLATGGGSGSVTSVGFTGGLISVADPTGAAALTVTGTSGGIPYFSSGSTWASSPALTLNLPLFGGGAGAAPFVGTVSGNTTKVATWSGAATAGRCVETDASGNLVISGSGCNVSTANMTITTGSGDPVGACTPALDWYQNTATTPKRPWYCDTSGTWRLIVTSTGSGAFSITGSVQATPSTPAAGSVTTYFDSTSKSIASVGDGGVVAYGAKNVTCSNQFVSAAAGGTFTCTTPTLSGAQFANQGTTTTVLHGNASGNPSFAQVSLTADVSGALPTANQAAAGLVRTCEIVIGDPGAASSALADDNDTPAVCDNATGATMTITAVACYADAGTPTVTPIITGGGATTILTGALTCGTGSYAAGTLNGTPTQTNGQTIDGNLTVAGGVAKYVVIRVVRTL